MLSAQEEQILKTLAKKYAEIASGPEQKERKELWLALNRCRMQRPMVLIDQIPWNEMDVDGSLVCQVSDPYWRRFENEMRQTLYKWKHMPVDMVINPYLTLPRPIENSGWGLSVEEDLLQTDRSSDIASHKYHNQIRDFEDVEKIKMPDVRCDRQAEERIIKTAERLFDGIIPFRMVGPTLHLGIWDLISAWMGVENVYIELIDRPELIHAIMEKMTGGLLRMIAQMNKEGLFDIYGNMCHCSCTLSDDLPHADCDPDRPTSQNAWAFGLAQLFSYVSPAVTDEFEVAYMRRVFPYFGAIYYGCCDRLDDRLEMLFKLPNVRKISCSPWSNREEFARKLPRKYVMSNKPNPALLSTGSLEEDAIRADIRRTIAAARENHVSLELIQKDISTVRYQPERLWRWALIAMEEVRR